MRIIVDGRRTGKGNYACYLDNRAYLTKKGLNKRTILHEFYHHLIEAKGLEIAGTMEEKETRKYSVKFLRDISKR